MKKILVWLAGAAFLLSTAALAEDKTAEELAIVQRVFAETANGAQYWTVLPNGVVRHKNSGLVCGARIGEIPLALLASLPNSPVPDGSVNCRYVDTKKEQDNAGVYDVFAFSPGKALGGQDAFDAFRTALMTAHSDAVSVTTFPVLNDPEARGEAFVITVAGKRRLTLVCTSVVHNWVVAVRFTAVPLPPGVDEAFTKTIANTISVFPQALLYRGMRGVVTKELGKPDPPNGF